MAYRILAVEDDEQIGKVIRQGLEEAGFEVTLQNDGNKAKTVIKNQYFDAIVLDVMLPGINGLDLCKQIRLNGIQAPILMLTALNEVDDRIRGLDYGADDYLGKPFHLNELVARVNALIRRNSDRGGEILQIEDLILDCNARNVSRAGQDISLTAKEMSLLEFLLRHQEKVVSRALIAEKVWCINFDTGTNMVDVYVNYLRKKIDKPFEKKLIQTVVGFGYKLSGKSEG